MPMTTENTWRAGRFGWGGGSAIASGDLSVLIFDLDALVDIECDGHRVAYNAAFAAHGLDFQWSATRYRQLLALGDERQRIMAELRKRGIEVECDVLMKVLADDIYATKAIMFDELIADATLTPRPGLLEFVSDAVAAGVLLGVVTTGRRQWAEPLVRRMFGDGLVTSLVTADDVAKTLPCGESFKLCLADLGASSRQAMAFVGSAAGLRAATTEVLATVVITGDGTPKFPAAVAVRADYAGESPLDLAEIRRLHAEWRRHLAPAAVA